MSTISVDFDVLNQRGSPAWFTDTFANIPTAGFVGRMFISKDTFAFYRDTGSGWDLIGGPGIGTLTGSGVVGQVSFFNGTQVLAGNNNLFWDNTNSRLGINTTTPGQPLDIHSTGNTLVQLNNTSTGNSNISFQNQNVAKWRVGNVYNAGANSFDIQNAGLSTNAISINSTTNNVNFGSTIGNGTYTYTLPGATGTLALTSALSSYVPYTGATTNVTLGAFNLTADNINLNSNLASLTRDLVNSIGILRLQKGANGYIQPTTLAVDRTYTLPDASGTFALGTGTTNTLPKFTGTSAIGDSNITDSGSLITLGSNSYINGNLGVGTTPLTQYNIRVLKNITGAVTSYGISSEGIIQTDVTTGAAYFSSLPSTAAASFTVSNIYHFIANQGSFGAGSTVTNQYGFFANSILTGATNNYGFYGNIPSGTNRWNLYMAGTAANYMAGVLNIGTTTLSGYTLDVNGTTRLQSDALINGLTFGRGAGNIATNTVVGASAGAANTSGFLCTFVGAGAGQSHTIGNANTFIGYDAGKATNTGFSNTFIGRAAGLVNTTGQQNYFGSHAAGESNTTGNKNVGVGNSSLGGNISGNNNSSLGHNSGRYISDGTTANSITNNSIYIGYETKALADNQTNQIVIGYNTVGLGSNTTVLGNSSTTLTALYGAVITGGTSVNASAQLQVDSTVRGFLPPVMTTTQKNAISTPATGLVVFDSTLGKLCVFSTTWQTITSV